MSQEAGIPARPPREQWSGQLGFILAAIGSAVGLGNIWRFPGTAYDNGGGAFLIPYIVALLTAGIPILWLDYSLGHRFRGSAPAAFRRLTKKAEALGWFQVALSCAIAMYYTVIIAWAASYMVFAANQRWGDDPTAFFLGDFLQLADEPSIGFEIVPSVFVPLVIVWIAALAILAFGLKRGIERANLVFIPLLVVVFIAIVIRAITLDGAADGLNALFTPQWDALTDPGVWVAAYAQIFFSLSIAFGIMITYSSYLKRKANLTSAGLVVGLGNSSFEILAGIGVFSAVGFMALQQGITVDETAYQGVFLAFAAFPQILSMMPAGEIFGVLFFGALILAGMTSLLSILQVASAAFQEKLGWSPRRGALTVGGVIAVLSIVLFSTTTALYVLDVADKFVNEVGVVLSAVVATVLVGLVLRKLNDLRLHLNHERPGLNVGRWWVWDVGLLVPLLLGYMLVNGVITLITDGYDGYPTGFLTQVGWGVMALTIVMSVIMAVVRWKQNPDDFTPQPLPEVASATKGADR